MTDYHFQRECRTPYSEAYLINSGDEWVGRIDLHYTLDVVNAVLCVGENMTAEDIRELIDIVDDEIVIPADVPRDDFIVTVYQGRETGIFSDEECNNEEAFED